MSVFFYLSEKEVEITSDQAFVSVYLGQNNPFFRVQIKIEPTVFPGAPLFPFLPGWAPFPFTKTLSHYKLVLFHFQVSSKIIEDFLLPLTL